MAVLPSEDRITALDVAEAAAREGRQPEHSAQAPPTVPRRAAGSRRRYHSRAGRDRRCCAPRAPAMRRSSNCCLKHGALVDLPSKEGVTPLMAAAGVEFGTRVTRGRNRTTDGVLATMKLLIDAGADVNARMVTDSPREVRCSAAAAAATRPRRVDVASQVPTPDGRARPDRDHGAAERGYTPIVKFLAEQRRGSHREGRDRPDGARSRPGRRRPGRQVRRRGPASRDRRRARVVDGGQGHPAFGSPVSRAQGAMRVLKATILACLAGASLFCAGGLPIDLMGDLWRRFRRPAVLTAHPDRYQERFEAEARLAVRRCGPGRVGERGRPKPGHSHFCAGRPLYVDRAAIHRGAGSGNRERDLEVRDRKRRRAESRRLVLARRRRAAPANPRGHVQWPSARARCRDGQAGADLRQSGRDRFARWRRREVPEDAVPDGLARDHLPEPHHHRRARPGRQSRRSRDGRSRLGSQNRQAGLDLPHDSAPGRARVRHLARRLLDHRRLAGATGASASVDAARADLPPDRPARGAILRRRAHSRICTRRRSSRSMPPPARCAGTSSSRITTCGTTTTRPPALDRRRPRTADEFRPWSRFRSRA